jgi:hypothetical protein
MFFPHTLDQFQEEKSVLNFEGTRKIEKLLSSL